MNASNTQFPRYLFFCEGGTFSAHGFTSVGSKLTPFMRYNVEMLLKNKLCSLYGKCCVVLMYISIQAKIVYEQYHICIDGKVFKKRILKNTQMRERFCPFSRYPEIRNK